MKIRSVCTGNDTSRAPCVSCEYPLLLLRSDRDRAWRVLESF